MKHVLSLFDLQSAEVKKVLSMAAQLKQKVNSGKRTDFLAGLNIGLLFQKQSLRTRVSFEVGIRQLGGSSVYLASDVGFGKREPIKDISRILGSYVDGLVFRGHDHRDVEELATHCPCSVINGLTDQYHPCQGLADALTIQESFGDRDDLVVTFVGDGNNVAKSLALACAHLGWTFRIGAPKEYAFEEDFLKSLLERFPKANIEITSDPKAASKDAHVLYADVWTSMGQEAESEKRRKDFADFQIDNRLMDLADSSAIFLHCLPAIREEEVTSEVIDGSASRIYDQAENRMHAQKALLCMLLADRRPEIETFEFHL